MWSKINSEEHTVNHLSGTYRLARFFTVLIAALIFAAGCAHYPVNQALDQYSPDKGYRLKNMGVPGNSDELFLVLTFSGGGTRAAALAYGVLEELARTEVYIDGRKRRLLDEVDVMSGVSGGSFTAGYYGLFGDRIFEDFESRFLKKNIQGALVARGLLHIPNWFRFFSSYYGKSDMAAEYYDKYVFDGGTFADIAARGGPGIFMNATDLTAGTSFPFIQEQFDLLCSDVSSVSVARAAAASSAVPVVLTPIVLRNYSGRCGYTPEWIDEAVTDKKITTRRYHQAVHLKPYLDDEKKPFVHLVDGGIADNLGLRVAINRITQMGDAWTSMKYVGMEKVRKIVFIIVNAQTAVDTSQDLKGSTGSLFDILGSLVSTPLNKYSYETLMLLVSETKKWSDEIKSGRCSDPDYNHDSVPCDEIKFYLSDVDFNNVEDKSERRFFETLPTSFKLPAETVDKLNEVGGRLLRNSAPYQDLLKDLK